MQKNIYLYKFESNNKIKIVFRSSDIGYTFKVGQKLTFEGRDRFYVFDGRKERKGLLDISVSRSFVLYLY